MQDRNDLDSDTQLTWLGALSEPVRRLLYRFVAEQPTPVSRDQAAQELDLPRHVAKFHLDRLADEGLLDTDYQRPAGRRGPGAGRPTKLYRAAHDEVAASVPERHYDLAADILAQAVTTAQQTGAPIQDAVRTAAREAGAGLAEPAAGGNAVDPVDPLCRALTAHGYEPVAGGTSEQPAEIVLRNCPFHRLAETHTELVCHLNLELLTGLVGRYPELGLQARLDPAPGRCCVTITRASEGRARGNRPMREP